MLNKNKILLVIFVCLFSFVRLDEESTVESTNPETPKNDQNSETSTLEESMTSQGDIPNLFLELDDSGLPKEDPVECKQDVLKAFGILEPSLEKSRKASPYEKSYCTTNTTTCCTKNDFKLANYTFILGKVELRHRFEILEELFILFKGNKFLEYMNETPSDENCQLNFDILKREDLGEKYDEYFNAYLELKVEKINNMLIDFESYNKKINWLRSNVICTVCNPSKQQYFRLEGEGNLKMDVFIGFCSQVWNIRYFEIELITMYQVFIRKIINFIMCKNGIDDEKLKLIELPNEKINLMKKEFNECTMDSTLSKPECQKFCYRNIFEYSFPLENVFTNLQISLSVLFEALTGMSIDDYYNDYKESSFEIGSEENKIKFFFNGHQQRHGIDVTNLEWNYKTDSGVMIFNDFMTKKFVNADHNTLREFAHKYHDKYLLKNSQIMSIITCILGALLLFK